jgi:hypothetical protein
MKKYLMMLLMPFIILMDYSIWNLILAKQFGYVTLSKCVEDNLKQLIKI